MIDEQKWRTLCSSNASLLEYTSSYKICRIQQLKTAKNEKAKKYIKLKKNDGLLRVSTLQTIIFRYQDGESHANMTESGACEV